jgi:hypothetical protein
VSGLDSTKAYTGALIPAANVTTDTKGQVTLKDNTGTANQADELRALSSSSVQAAGLARRSRSLASTTMRAHVGVFAGHQPAHPVGELGQGPGDGGRDAAGLAVGGGADRRGQRARAAPVVRDTSPASPCTDRSRAARSTLVPTTASALAPTVRAVWT